jgi:tetrahydromethanopterin S-methyltransferase subunit G
MAEHDYPARPSSYSDLFDRLDRIEDKLDLRLDTLDRKVDAVTSRIDRIEGAVQIVRWLGPVGVAALVYGLLTSQGLI